MNKTYQLSIHFQNPINSVLYKQNEIKKVVDKSKKNSEYESLDEYNFLILFRNEKLCNKINNLSVQKNY